MGATGADVANIGEFERRNVRKAYLRCFLKRSPAGVSRTRIPPDSVSPAEMDRGRSTRAAPSFSMMSMAACKRPITTIRVNP